MEPGTAEPGPAADAASPQRVLIVSADIGEGHNAVGRALEEAAGKTWPGCEVAWLDSLAAMGPGMGPLARAVYRMQVQHTPAVYEFFFRAIWRHRWFLESTRRVIGWWCGRRMARQISRFRPDVIISTYPLGSAGLSWLRSRGRLGVPAGAWVSDFCPHPYWLYRDLDLTYVMHHSAVPVAAAAEPGIRVQVCALPVRGNFQPAGRGQARAKLGLDAGQFVVLLSTGSLGFGNVEQAAAAILAADPGLLLVVVCGRNQRLQARLRARGEPPDRMLVLGWTEDMPAWITAADVLVTNGGGMTALEAVACGRPVIMFQPIAAHGRANAELMAAAGLAVVCTGETGLTTAIRRELGSPARRAALAAAAADRAGASDPGDDLRCLAALPPKVTGTFPLRAEDALFLYAETPACPQQVGAVVVLHGQPLGLGAVCAALAARVAEVPALRRRLVRPRWRWGRPRWAVEPQIEVRSRVREVSLPDGSDRRSLDELAARYFAAPLDLTTAPWELLVVRGYRPDPGAGSQDVFLVKMHHCLGDSFALVAALSGLFDQASQAAGQAAPPRRRWHALVREAARARPVAAGLYAMVRSGRPPGRRRPAVADRPDRRFAHFSLPARDVIVTARRLHTNATDLVLALVVDALSRRLVALGEPVPGRSVRIMVPRTVSAFGPRSRAVTGLAGPAAAGNRTAGVLLDLPLADMPLAERAAVVHELHRRCLRRGDAEAAAFVLRVVNLAPPPLQRRFARATYSGAWFSTVVSVFPGIRRPSYLLGAQIREVYPVLAPAGRMSLAIGAITWGDRMSVGLVGSDVLIADPGLLAEEIQRSFSACLRSAGGGH